MAISDLTDDAMRQRRQLADAAIAHATRSDWEAAVAANQSLLELGPDIDAYNRLGKALAELSRHAEALVAYEAALERDATNRIAQRNVERLRLLVAAASDSDENGKPVKAPATLFIEEMGKTGHARLINLAPPRRLAQLSGGDVVELRAESDLLMAYAGEGEIGQVEPRIATRLVKLMRGGNRYEAAITNLHDDEVRIIIREVFAHPDNFGKVSFPGSTAAGPGAIRPYF
jgi:tetratricopeptide (TPR) repeat protein